MNPTSKQTMENVSSKRGGKTRCLILIYEYHRLHPLDFDFDFDFNLIIWLLQGNGQRTSKETKQSPCNNYNHNYNHNHDYNHNHNHNHNYNHNHNHNCNSAILSDLYHQFHNLVFLLPFLQPFVSCHKKTIWEDRVCRCCCRLYDEERASRNRLIFNNN